MKARSRTIRVETLAGRVVVGPKELRRCYVRIVSRKDRSGRIEKFDPASGAWLPAPDSITFSEVWSAPQASMAPRARTEGEP